VEAHAEEATICIIEITTNMTTGFLGLRLEYAVASGGSFQLLLL
jgi:hypothetical protein